MLNTSRIEGIMTDRIDDLQGYFMPHVREAAKKLAAQAENEKKKK